MCSWNNGARITASAYLAEVSRSYREAETRGLKASAAEALEHEEQINKLRESYWARVHHIQKLQGAALSEADKRRKK